MNVTDTQAQAFLNKAKEYSFNVCVDGAVLCVYKKFIPGDNLAFANAEMDANTLLDMVKETSAGSTWGTDGASIGGAIGLQQGYMKLKKSGCSKRVLAAIKKLNHPFVIE